MSFTDIMRKPIGLLIVVLVSLVYSQKFTPPQNPELEYVTKDSVGISWTSPIEVIGLISYKIVAFNINKKFVKGYSFKKNSLRGTIPNLDSCSKYKLYFGAQFQERIDYSKVVLNVTIGIEFMPVENIEVQVNYGNDIQYSFSHTQNMSLECEKSVVYRVVLYELSDEDHWMPLLDYESAMMTGEFRGLNFNSKFMIGIRPVLWATDLFFGMEIRSKIVTTKLDLTDSFPKNLEVTDVQPTSAYLTWIKPKNPFGVINEYFIEFLNGKLAGHRMSLTTDSHLGYKLENLSPCTEYKLQIRARTAIDSNRIDSEPSNVVMFTTKKLDKLFTIANVSMDLDELGNFLIVLVNDPRLNIPPSCGRIEFKYTLWRYEDVQDENSMKVMEQTVIISNSIMNFDHLKYGKKYVASVTCRFINQEWPSDEVFSNAIEIPVLKSIITKVDVELIPPRQIKFTVVMDFIKPKDQLFIAQLFMNNNQLIQTMLTTKMSGTFFLNRLNTEYYIGIRTKLGTSMSPEVISDIIRI